MGGTLAMAKGHGTQNDFILLPDPDGRLDLSPGLVVALCDRRSGLGADGVLRVVRSEHLPQGRPLAATAEWFMDYRNADGSAAEMCGNGLRVFAAYLHASGLAPIPDGRGLTVGTRVGVRTVRRDDDIYAADLGPWRIVGGAAAAARGEDVTVRLAGLPAEHDVPLPGLSVDVGNPHVVVALPDLDLLRAVDLTRAPIVHPAPPHGTNVEMMVPSPDGDGRRGHLVMRVHERGVGETRSCGTGAVAAALAARVWAGASAADHWWVDVPGGRLRVDAPTGDRLAGSAVVLAGPAVIVAEGTMDAAWLAGHSTVTADSRLAARSAT